jgi:hypothetical protein
MDSFGSTQENITSEDGKSRTISETAVDGAEEESKADDNRELQFKDLKE